MSDLVTLEDNQLNMTQKSDDRILRTVTEHFLEFLKGLPVVTHCFVYYDYRHVLVRYASAEYGTNFELVVHDHKTMLFVSTAKDRNMTPEEVFDHADPGFPANLEGRLSAVIGSGT